MSRKYAAANTCKRPTLAKPTALTFLLFASLVILSATPLFAQVGVRFQKPVNVPDPTANMSTGPDSDKQLVQKRWDVILKTPAVKKPAKEKSAPQEAAKSPEVPKLEQAATSPDSPQ